MCYVLGSVNFMRWMFLSPLQSRDIRHKVFKWLASCYTGRKWQMSGAEPRQLGFRVTESSWLCTYKLQFGMALTWNVTNIRMTGFECISTLSFSKFAYHLISETSKIWSSDFFFSFFSSYDQRGIYLLVGTSEGFVFIINANPSSLFQILGFIGTT